MSLSDLTPEQMEKAKACKTTEELLELAKEQGQELTLDDLEGVAGGEHWACNCDEGYAYNPVN